MTNSIPLTVPTYGPTHRSYVMAARARRNKVDSRNPLNTVDQALAFARMYSAEIRENANSRRVYRTFLALTKNQFEALLAFSIWKVRGQTAP